MDSNELRHQMAKNAIGNVRRFQIDEIADRWQLLFEDVLNS